MTKETQRKEMGKTNFDTPLGKLALGLAVWSVIRIITYAADEFIVYGLTPYNFILVTAVVALFSVATYVLGKVVVWIDRKFLRGKFE